VLFAIAFATVALAGAGELASTAAKREREAELLFAGDQIAQAIAAYRAASPGAPRYPANLADLVRDPRHPQVRRHLRRIHLDPMTGRADWGVVRAPDGGIAGVYSRSLERPLKRSGFPDGYEGFAGAERYADWAFVARADAGASAPAPRSSVTSPAPR
jgi:type II secretory pathway pseudopilin PulG